MINAKVSNESYYGINSDVNAPIYYDKTKMGTGHELILGMHGSGKTYLCKKELKRIYKNTNDSIIVIQDITECANSNLFNNREIDYSYKSLAKLHNEKHVEVSRLLENPLLIPDYENDLNRYERILFHKEYFLLNLINIILNGEITALQRSILDRSILEMYSKPTNRPTFSSFLEILKMKNENGELDVIIKDIEKKLQLGLRNFNTKDIKEDFESRFTVYSMCDVKNVVYNETIFILLELIRNTVIKNFEKGKKTHIVLDCFEMLHNNNKIIIEFITYMIRSLRIYGGMITIIATDAEYLFKNNMNIIENIHSIRLLNQNKTNAKVVLEYLSLSKNLMEYICDVENGTRLFCVPEITIPFEYK